ncbi:MAG: hypothetical protein DHS80DRAFT_28927 [Piptocephalis tieghemiana]|nr:MAG: hypothetical protein DHS80DRAFT_28927 [Piptocephalis tieghemiana]
MSVMAYAASPLLSAICNDPANLGLCQTVASNLDIPFTPTVSPTVPTPSASSAVTRFDTSRTSEPSSTSPALTSSTFTSNPSSTLASTPGVDHTSYVEPTRDRATGLIIGCSIGGAGVVVIIIASLVYWAIKGRMGPRLDEEEGTSLKN